jgi:signal transduction histidine kinase
MSRRLVGFSLVFVTTTIVVASVILYLIIAGVVREQVDQRLDTQIDGLRGALSVNAGTLVLATALDGPPFDRQGSGWYWQISGNQQHITSRSLAGQSMDSPPRPFEWRHVFGGEPQRADGVQFRGEELYVRVAAASIGGKAIEISVTAPQSALTAPARRALLWLVPTMAVLGAILVAGVLLQVRYGLRPLRQLTSNVSEITAGSLSRLPDIDVEELRPVAREINRLVDQNAQRLIDTRLHFANLAHGLKTPVASLSLALNSGNDPEGEMRSLVDRIDQRIRHHLARARKTAAGGTGISTAIKSRIDDLMLVMSRIYADRGITAHCDVDPDLSVACPGEDLDEILGNLIDNAFKWATSSIAISAKIAGSEVVIMIEDDGRGMPPAAVADALLPGKRMDETVPGDGFGLTIASELIQLYGGTITLSNATDAGLQCSLSLPRAVLSV